MKTVVKLALATAVSFYATQGIGGDYATLRSWEIQIPGHPYKTARDCERRAPIGEFDRLCDIPLLGYRNFVDPTINIGSGSVGSTGY